jgi:hypothetical protein
MTHEPFRFELPDPISVTLYLPKAKGKIRARLKTVEVRRLGEPWLLLEVPAWERWSTQARVGEPPLEGVGPTVTDMWAPAEAVMGDEEDIEAVRDLVYGRRCEG